MAVGTSLAIHQTDNRDTETGKAAENPSGITS